MKNNQLALIIVAAVISFHAKHCRATESTTSEKPNVIYIMADEFGYYQPGFMGAKIIKTPHLDRLASQSLVMTNMLAGNASCSPTRSALMTGKHGGHGSIRSNGGYSIRAEEVTIAEMLKEQGYATGGFGKWGIGGRGSEGVPEKNGFDVFFGYYNQAHAHTYYPAYLIRNSEEVPQEGNRGGRKGETYSQYVIHDAAKQWIRDHAAEPFFAYLPYTLPHGPFAIPDDDPSLEQYKDLGLGKDEVLYAAMNTLLDTHVGEIVSLLNELGIEKNTLIMFSGDNGYGKTLGGNKSPDSDFEFRGEKSNLYDGGLRVPFFAYWPGKIAAGQRSDFVSYFPDVMPTIAEATAAKLPAEANGVSILPTLIGEKAAGHAQTPHDFLYWNHKEWKALRQNDWTLIKGPKSRTWELYNVQSDPGQKDDLATKQPGKLQELVILADGAHEAQREGIYQSREWDDRDKHAK
jgi:arylsulfatase A-like enzyme